MKTYINFRTISLLAGLLSFDVLSSCVGVGQVMVSDSDSTQDGSTMQRNVEGPSLALNSLGWAIQNGNLDTVKSIIISSKKRPQEEQIAIHQVADGFTSLQLALNKKQLKISMLLVTECRDILIHILDVTDQAKTGLGVLDLIKEQGSSESSSEDIAKVLDLLIKPFHDAAAPGDIDQLKNILAGTGIQNLPEKHKQAFLNSVLDEKTVLGKVIMESKNNVLEMLKLLIQEKQLDINNTGTRFPSFLLAIKLGRWEIARFLLTECGDRLNVTTPDPETGNTALHLIMEKGNSKDSAELLGLLLKNHLAKIDLTAKNQDKRLPLDLADQNGCLLKVLDLLIKPFHDAAARGDIDQFKNILAGIQNLPEKHKQAFLNSVLDEKTVLGKVIMESKNNVLEMLKLLIQEKQVDVNNTGVYLSSLLLALNLGQSKVAMILLTDTECRDRLNVTDKDPETGWTSLHWAAERGYFNVVEALLKYKGIEVDIKNKDGHTPLDLAKENRHTDCIEALQDFMDAQKATS